MKILKKLYNTLTGYRSRSTYWGCSEFSNNARAWLGTEIKPQSASPADWSKWHKDNKGTLGYWITEELLDKLQDIVLFIPDVYHNISTYVRNRFITKTHYLNTRLQKGQWHDFDSRILHGLFESLVDFVEIEKAHMRNFSNPPVKLPSRTQGLAYIQWEIDLKEESPVQAKTAEEIRNLYVWWKDIRPARPDTMEESGLSAYYDRYRENSDDGKFDIFATLGSEKTPKEQEEYNKLSDKSVEIDKMYEDEDDEMIIRLIKIRSNMWT